MESRGPFPQDQGWGVPKNERHAGPDGEVSKEAVSPGGLWVEKQKDWGKLGGKSIRFAKSPERSRGLSQRRCHGLTLQLNNVPAMPVLAGL